MLLRLKRRFRSWLAPAVAVVLFGAMFAVSTLWIGPAIRGDTDQGSPAHDDHNHTGLVTIGGLSWKV